MQKQCHKQFSHQKIFPFYNTPQKIYAPKSRHFIPPSPGGINVMYIIISSYNNILWYMYIYIIVVEKVAQIKVWEMTEDLPFYS